MMLVALVLGTALALVALGYVLYPLFTGVPEETTSRAVEPASDPVQVLREIEFDRVTGKLSDSDYEALRAQYTRAAIEQMRSGEATPGETPAIVPPPLATPTDEAERLIARMRRSLACRSCGPRPTSRMSVLDAEVKCGSTVRASVPGVESC
jgi:hypothetical protein